MRRVTPAIMAPFSCHPDKDRRTNSCLPLKDVFSLLLTNLSADLATDLNGPVSRLVARVVRFGLTLIWTWLGKLSTVQWNANMDRLMR